MVDGCRIRELPDGGREFVLDEPALTSLRIDEHTGLLFGQTEVVIERPFDLILEGRVERLDPGQPATLGPLLTLYPATVRWMWTSVDGELTVEFHGGEKLRVRPDPLTRAWSVGNIYCLPAGRS